MIPKTLESFRESLKNPAPPEGWPAPLKALWHDAQGQWEASHNIAQDLDTPMGSWIHGHLHRREGDSWNAGYWYRQAGKPYPQHSLEKELWILVRANLP